MQACKFKSKKQRAWRLSSAIERLVNDDGEVSTVLAQPFPGNSMATIDICPEKFFRSCKLTKSVSAVIYAEEGPEKIFDFQAYLKLTSIFSFEAPYPIYFHGQCYR